jgi:hypothetical protein
MKSKSFVDKVYDAYIKEDYSYGDNNLNPKREIKQMSLKNTDDQLNRILASIQRKVTEISMKYPVNTFEVNEAIGNFGGSGGKLKNIPASLREAIFNAGGTGNNLIMIPSMDGDTSPIISDIEITIAKILATIGSAPPPELEGGGGGEDWPSNSGLDLFDINCNGTLSLIPGVTNGNSDYDDNNSNGDGFSNISGGSGYDENDDNDNGLNLNDGFTDSTLDTADAIMEDAVDKALEQMERDLVQQKANARSCAIKDLGLLKAFLAILQVIQKIKKAMNPLMNILMDVVKLTVLAAGCWNNPTNVAEIIQRIVIKLVAILIMVVAMLVQMFWEMLGLDCLTEEAKSIIDQIKEALTGVTNTYNQCERLAMSFGANVEKVKDAFDEAKGAIDEAMKNLSTDHLKEMFPNLNDMAKDIYNNGLGGNKGLKQSVISGLQSTGAYNDILSTIEDVKALKETADNTIDSIMKTKGGKAANATVRKIAAQLHDVQAR